MASENCMSIMDSWSYRPSLPETLWMSDAFARDNDVLTRALQASLSTSSETQTQTQTQIQQQPDAAAAAAADNNNNKRSITLRSNRTDPATTITGKVSKRKSRASKKSPTTYINADPANFRQMVQQVTGGVRFPLDPVLLLKPEPQRAAAAAGPSHHRAGAVLPTLDTSALLMRDAAAFSAAFSSAAGGYAPVGPPAEGDAGSDSVSGPRSGSAFGFDSFSSFPTLESWGGM